MCCQCIVEDKSLLCLGCGFDLPFTHMNFGTNNPAHEQLYQLCGVEQAFSLLRFKKQNITQKLLHELKYKGNQQIGVWLATCVAEQINIKNSAFVAIIPMPIHPKKLKQRGYNQVHTFAKTLSDLYGIDCRADVLIRAKQSKSQVFKNKEERWISLQHNFVLLDNDLQNKHIILVDDVMTTGASLATCANLFAKQNTKVSVITMACVF